MKTCVFFLCLTLLLSACYAYFPLFHNGRPREGLLGKSRHQASSGRLGLPKPSWFKQRLDHFEVDNNRTWMQRYAVNDTFYKDGGPLFVQIGGEGPLDPIWAVEGNWIDYAQTFNALCVLVEHRYYGESHPTPDMELENMMYLSSQQALADVAAIIIDFKAKYNTSKTLVFGGSYSGSLAAWFRLKYPHLADGAISSSAPLLAKVNFLEYLEVVYRSLQTYKGTTACDDSVQDATKAFEALVASSSGRAELKKMFLLCDDIDVSNAKDMSNLYSTVSNFILGVVQYDKDNRAFEGAKDSNITIDVVCEMMTDGSWGSPLHRYAQVNEMFLKVYGEKCLDFKYDAMISDLRQTKWTKDTSGGARQWTYQTCTEFGYYQSSDSNLQPFGHHFPLEFWIEQCMDIFGKKFNDSFLSFVVKRTNGYYGALDIKVTRVVFYNGSLDPWHALGITTKTGMTDVHTFYVNGTAHCAMMYPATETDVPSLKDARQQTQQIIRGWGF